MSESLSHLELVRCIANWVRTCSFLGDDPLVYSDLPESTIQQKPKALITHKPDVIACSRRSDRKIFGEAKTSSDLESLRSRRQLLEFLQCANTKDSALVVATHWDYTRCAGSILKSLCSHSEIASPNYAVLDQFGHVVINSNDWV